MPILCNYLIQSHIAISLSRILCATCSLLISSRLSSEFFVISVTILVSVPKPAPALFKLLAQIMSQCLLSSFFREFSSTFSVSMEKPHKICPGLLFSPRAFKMSFVRTRGIDRSPSFFLILLSSVTAGV